MKENAITIRNGSIDAVATPTVFDAPTMLSRHFSDDDLIYLKEAGAENQLLSNAHSKMLSKKAKLQKAIAKMPESQQLRDLNAKIKELTARQSANTLKAEGVIERALQGFMPGASLEEKLIELVSLSQTNQPKKLNGKS